MPPAEIVLAAVTADVEPAYWTKTDPPVTVNTGPSSMSSVPFLSSNAEAVALETRPNSAPASSTYTDEVTSSRTVTSSPTTWISDPTLLKPRSPLSVNTPATSASRPTTENAVVSFAMAASKV